jgi:hypothetical protein
MTLPPLLLALLALAACATPADSYTEDRSAAQCAVFARCDQLGDLGFRDEAACTAALVADGTYACRDTLDAAAARVCLHALEAASCDELAGGAYDLSTCAAACVDEYPSW